MERPGPQRKGKGPLPGCLHVFGSLTGGITDRPRGGDTHQISAVRPVQSLLSQRVCLRPIHECSNFCRKISAR